MSTVTRNAKKSEVVLLAGSTMTGQLNFSGTTHAGLKVLSLTTAQRDALTAAVGMVIYNTTTGAYNCYDGAWKVVSIATSGNLIEESGTDIYVGGSSTLHTDYYFGKGSTTTDDGAIQIKATPDTNNASGRGLNICGGAGSAAQGGSVNIKNGDNVVMLALSSNAYGLIATIGAGTAGTLGGNLRITAGAADLTPSSDPTAGVEIWSESGVSGICYRTNLSNEGAGANNRLHNRASQIVGVGTDYTVTNSYARVDFGTTDAEISLPSAGTYRVSALVSVTNGATADDVYSCKFYNSTDAADVASSERTITGGNASAQNQIVLENIVTVTTNKTIQIYGVNSTAARGTIVSTKTSINYVRLH